MHASSALSLLSALLAAAPFASACTGPAINDASLMLIESFEGWRASPYRDVGGLPTIGYGHLCSRSDCSEIKYSIPLSKADGSKLLQSDVAKARNCITQQTASSVQLNANQYGALVSWAFNMGCGATGSSTVIRELNAGKMSANEIAAKELPKWNHVGKNTVKGLTRRRTAEIALFKTASSDKALPACS